MLFPKTFPIAVAAALVAIASSFVEATPISVDAVSEYVPLSKRTYTTEEIETYERFQKRSSAGFNDWSCKTSLAHPRPLILVHGLIGNGWDNWLYMAPRFVAKGYCVFSLTYGRLNEAPLFAGLDKMENSAEQLSAFVDKVLAATNSTKVNLVGHSQGSLMPRVIDPACLSCYQFLENSPFLQNLNAGGDTVPGVSYKFIVSKVDKVVTPYTNGLLRDTNPLVKNVVLQSLCPTDVSEHVLQMTDPIVFNEINAFLDPKALQIVNCLSAML
ncbi:hypothetical protein BGZ72_007121 [Mortierella alpina]|nr:hypothetical protein BGZ72_007121 [Mortierella alpina]